MLVVWCPDWPIVAAAQPGPVVIIDAGVVRACSAAARQREVRRGLRRREAQARCPDAVVIAHDEARDARAFEPVVAALERAFVPAVEIIRPGVCAFPARGPARYFGGEEQLAGQVATAVDVECRVGIADGSFAAQLAARRGIVVPPGGSAAFLASFPVGVLDRPDLVDLLRRLGVKTLGDLAALPARAVLGRFGPDGALAHRLARGLDPRPPAVRVPPPELTVTAELDPPVDRVDAAAFVARGIAAELADGLARRGLACARLRIEAETEHGEHLTRLWRHDGTLSAGAMAERVRWQLDGWLVHHPAPGALVLLRLTPEDLRPDRGRQLGFWGPGTAADDDRAARALARVQGLLGLEAVVTGVLDGGRGFAEQVRLVPWGDARDTEPDSHALPWPGRLPMPAPATVHVSPWPADVVDERGHPVTVSGRGVPSSAPARVSIGGGPWSPLVAWAGPWPVDERWWDAAAHRRRACWQIRTADGTAHLLTLEAGRWFVDATYD
jgi:protein ImuB